jgi:hypothetical protein
MGSYLTFRPYVRDDFRGTCAYCLLLELFAGGQENFELDHFRPRHLFESLLNDFYNIYWACHPCNHIKRGAWPSEELQKQGYSFVDFCAADFSDHFREDADGGWIPLSQSGAYTADRLRLNRPHLKEIRRLLRQLERGAATE